MEGADIGNVVFTVLYGITILISAVGNTVLISIVWKRPEVRSLNSFMFVNMAVADLLVTLFMMPWSIAQLYSEGGWLMTGMLGEITCRGFFYIGSINLAASILCLIIMAIDRYYAVLQPWNRHTLWFRKAKVITPLIWFMALVLVSITCMFFDLVDDKWCVYDFEVFGQDLRETLKRFYFLYLFTIIYFIPLVIISVLYAIVAYKVWFHQTPGFHTTESQQHQELIKRRAVRMLIVIVVTFAACWLPSQVYDLLVAFKIQPSRNIMYLVYWCAHANSAINPWLYLGLSSNMNLALKNMVSKIRRTKPEIQGQRTTRNTRNTAIKNQKEQTDQL
ncbi:G-protein coupled receptor 83-like [Montipora capricornis]|uniref:G-protein coupled receptor 83-like n=1 Tax=Montipora capricornis TaxID=246305 RepID=UPI0035F0FC28